MRPTDWIVIAMFLASIVNLMFAAWLRQQTREALTEMREINAKLEQRVRDA